MPFSARVVEPRRDNSTIFQGNSINVSETAAVSNLVGALEQLNAISKCASEVFGALLQDAERNLDRITQVKQRMSNLEAQVVPTENSFVQNSPAYFYDNPYSGKEWVRRDNLRGLIFRRDRAAPHVNKRRAGAEPPPDMSILDRFGENGIPCIKRYTDPNFFMNERLQAEKLRVEEERRRRKAKKDGKKKKRKMQREETTKILKVQKKQFNPLGADFQNEHKSDGGLQYAEVKKYDYLDKESAFNPDSVEAHETPSGPPSNRGAPVPTGAAKTGEGAPMAQAAMVPHVPVSPKEGQTPMGPEDGKGGAPPPVPSGLVLPPIPSGGGFRLPPIPHFGQQAPSGPQGEGGEGGEGGGGEGGPPAMPAAPQMVPPPNPYSEQAYYQEPVARPPPQARKPILPQRDGNFLAEIKKGIELKKGETVKRELPQDSRSLLLSAVSKGAKLRHVDEAEVDKKKEEKVDENSSIFAVMQRRKFFEEDSEDSESSWGSEED